MRARLTPSRSSSLALLSPSFKELIRDLRDQPWVDQGGHADAFRPSSCRPDQCTVFSIYRPSYNKPISQQDKESFPPRHTTLNYLFVTNIRAFLNFTTTLPIHHGARD
ncbi:hypothetical protein FPOAC2_00342 [Fusarium poae]